MKILGNPKHFDECFEEIRFERVSEPPFFYQIFNENLRTPLDFDECFRKSDSSVYLNPPFFYQIFNENLREIPQILTNV